MTSANHFRIIFLSALLTFGVASFGESVGTGFGFQGQLLSGTNGAAGPCDLVFRLYDSSQAGTQIGAAITNTAILPTEGNFSTILDFGLSAFDGSARFLEITVRTNGGASFVTLSPRQPVMAVPYALRALTVQQVYSSNVVGTITSNQLPASLNANSAALTSAAIQNATINQLNATTLSGDGSRIRNAPVPPYALAKFAPVPPLIFSPWYDFYTDIATNQTDGYLRQVAQSMATNGLRDAGWNYIWLDDGWSSHSRDNSGNIAADSTRFPFGIPALVSYLHSLGFRVGIYSSFGPATCLAYPGSDEAHLAQDVKNFAAWGIDALKLDACFPPQYENSDAYNRSKLALTANAILDAHRDMLSFCITPTDTFQSYLPLPITWQAQYEANLFTTWGVTETVASVSNAVMNAAFTLQVAKGMIGPGHYPWQGAFDTRGMDLATLRAGMTMAAMVCAPLTIGSMWAPGVVNLLTNREVLSVLQDPAANCGALVWSNNLAEVWSRPLGAEGGGGVAVALVNMANTNQVLGFDARLLSSSKEYCYAVRDLWARSNVVACGSTWTNTVPAQTVQLFKATPRLPATTNVTVLRPGGGTNTLVFLDGVLVDVQP